MRITLAKIGNNKTVNFAVDELEKYLKLIDPESIVDRRVYREYKDSVQNVIWVGESCEFPATLPEVEDTELDDAILIDVAEMSGIIAGNNPRATLIAVYRFLKELGCAWVRNSRDGEIIPSYTMTPVSMYICEAASYRHRAVCIEGAVTFEHVRDMIDWIPKAGMNGYYIQFFLPTVFFERWNNHARNQYLPPEPIDSESVEATVYAIEEEIEKRGLLYHAVGHGWTSGPLGFDAAGWHEDSGENIPDEKRALLAQIDGERAFLKGVPMNTNLCYSNPEARKIMTDAVAEYCISHPAVKYVHFWLADYPNSFCECDACKKTLPSDHYVMMLNEIDEKLTSAGNNTKIVFLVYYDLLWAPEKERLNNPDRFTLMFAPITRKYSQSFKDEKFDSTDVPEFVRNKLIIPKNVSENLAHLKRWQELSGASDGFDFDYHLMWDHARDPGYFATTRTLFYDMQNLDKIGLRGMVSCQLTRSAFPTGLPMQMMADALWDKECDFEERCDDYFISAFGIDGIAVKEYTRTLSELMNPHENAWEFEPVTPEQKKNLLRALGVMSEFEKTVRKNLDTIENENMRRSWEYLIYHKEIYSRLAKALIRRADGADEAEREALANELCDYVSLNEMNVHRIIDCNNYVCFFREAITHYKEEK